MFTFTSHIKETVIKAKKKINVLKALAGTEWGCDKETMTNTYKTIGRSQLEYGAPIWSPLIKESLMDSLQTVQNNALRIATGSFKMAAMDHLHRETKVLPVKVHTQMITKQYLAACHLPGHPGREQLSRPPSIRNHKPTILQYREEIGSYFTNSNDETTYKAAIKCIHKKTVAATLSSYPPNKVLGTAPPEINPEEEDLPRKSRSLLSQLRSGYSKLLNSYNHRLNENTPDSCPKCSTSPHTTTHLFSCPDTPTELTPLSLWLQPKTTANYLNLEREEDPDVT